MSNGGFISEGRQRKYPHGFAHSVQVCDLHPKYFIIEELGVLGEVTYQYRRIIRRLCCALRLYWVLVDLDVLHVAAAKDNVRELLGRGRNEFVHLTTFGAKRKHIFEGNGRLFRIDLMQRPDVSGTVSLFSCSVGVLAGHT